MEKHLVAWLVGTVWIALAAALAAAYGVGAVTGTTLIFSGFCLMALGAIGFTFASRFVQPPETVGQILYETEHPTQGDKKQAA